MPQSAVLRDTGRSCLLATALAYLARASRQLACERRFRLRPTRPGTAPRRAARSIPPPVAVSLPSATAPWQSSTPLRHPLCTFRGDRTFRANAGGIIQLFDAKGFLGNTAIFRTKGTITQLTQRAPLAGLGPLLRDDDLLARAPARSRIGYAVRPAELPDSRSSHRDPCHASSVRRTAKRVHARLARGSALACSIAVSVSESSAAWASDEMANSLPSMSWTCTCSWVTASVTSARPVSRRAAWRCDCPETIR